jgi:hypothetical protein
VRPAVSRILDALLARHAGERSIHLNDLAEVIGAQAISQDEIELLVDALERAGFRVGEDPDEQDLAVMREVLASARGLREALGRPPTVEEIAAASARAPHVVRRALEHAASAKRARA